MARLMDLGLGNRQGEEIMEFGCSHIMFMLCMIMVSVFVLSMLIFACVDHGDHQSRTNHRYNGQSSSSYSHILGAGGAGAVYEEGGGGGGGGGDGGRGSSGGGDHHSDPHKARSSSSKYNRIFASGGAGSVYSEGAGGDGKQGSRVGLRGYSGSDCFIGSPRHDGGVWD